MRAFGPLVAALIAVALVISGALFTVDQRQNALVFQLGEVKEIITKPGLYFKWPLIQNVRFFDMRILSYDDAEPLRFITSEKKPVLVDSYVKWRIIDVRQFYVSVQGDEFRAAVITSYSIHYTKLYERYLPVLQDDKLLGVISFRDVAKAVLEEQDFENKMLKGYIKNWPA